MQRLIGTVLTVLALAVSGMGAAHAEPPTGPVLHLTFDDGPDPRWTPQVLDVLARHHVAATFFIVGKRADAYPSLVRRIVAQGHTVANHTYTHVDLRTVSEQRFHDEVDRTQRALGPDGRRCLRPPYGSTDQRVRDWTADAGYHLQLWTTDTGDYTLPGAEVIADRIVAGAHDGAVILLHDAGGTDRSQTVQGLTIALDRLAGGDWRYEHTC